MSIKNIEKKIIEIALSIAKDGKGALFVIGNKIEYKKMFKMGSIELSIFDTNASRLLKDISQFDGAVIISKEGKVVDYGVMIKSNKVFNGYGTRHAAAISASSVNGTIAILCSEQDKKVKIFRKGKYIMQLDPMTKGLNRTVPIAVSMLESIGAGTVGAVGVSTLFPAFGITFIPGLIIFGGSYTLLRKLFDKFG